MCKSGSFCATSVPRPLSDINLHMLRLYRKWRLVRRLRDESLAHIAKQDEDFISAGGAIGVDKTAFVQQTADRDWRARFWSGARKKEKLSQIYSILDSCIAEKFIDTSLNYDGRTLIKTSLLGEDFCGFSDLAEAVLSKYNSLAAKIIIPTVAFVLGGLLSGPIWRKADKPIHLTAEVAQVAPVTAQPADSQDTRTSEASKKEPHKSQPKPSSPKPPSTISQDCASGNCAASIGQQGGITAGQVNIGNLPRHLTKEQTDGIVVFLQGKSCKVSSMGYVVSSGDARDYGLEIRDALRAGGCIVGEDMSPSSRPNGNEHGIFVQYYDATAYKIGDKMQISQDSSEGVLIGALLQAHLPVSASPGPNVSEGNVEVIIGAP